jgi:hypothetical protein
MARLVMTARRVIADHVAGVIAARAVTVRIAENDPKPRRHMMTVLVSGVTDVVVATGSVVGVPAAPHHILAAVEVVADNRPRRHSIARRPTSLRRKARSPAGSIRPATADSFGSR